MGQLPEDGQQASNILQDVIDLSSDSEDDEVIEHWSPGFQFLDDEDFILGNLHHNAAPAAWKRANYTFKDLMLHPNKLLFPVACSVPQSMIMTTVNSIYTGQQHCRTASKERCEWTFQLSKRKSNVFFYFAFNIYVFLAKLLPSDLSFVSLFILYYHKTVLTFF